MAVAVVEEEVVVVAVAVVKAGVGSWVGSGASSSPIGGGQQ
jgi:hypothetical protein